MYLFKSVKNPCVLKTQSLILFFSKNMGYILTICFLKKFCAFLFCKDFMRFFSIISTYRSWNKTLYRFLNIAHFNYKIYPKFFAKRKPKVFKVFLRLGGCQIREDLHIRYT